MVYWERQIGICLSLRIWLCIFTIIYEHFYFRLRINSCMNTNSVFFIGCNLQE